MTQPGASSKPSTPLCNFCVHDCVARSLHSCRRDNEIWGYFTTAPFSSGLLLIPSFSGIFLTSLCLSSLTSLSKFLIRWSSFYFFFLFFCIISNHSLSFAKFILFCEGFDCYRKIGFIIFYFLPSSTIIPLFIPHVLLFYSFLLVALTTPFASYIDHCSFPFDRSTEALPRTHKEWCSSLPLGSVSLSVFLFLLLSLSFSFFMTLALSDSIPLILFISS